MITQALEETEFRVEELTAAVLMLIENSELSTAMMLLILIEGWALNSCGFIQVWLILIYGCLFLFCSLFLPLLSTSW